MSNNTDNNTSYQGVILTGPQNYAEWELSIKTSLILKDLEIGTPVSLDSMSSKEDKEKYKRSRQAFALLIKSLSPEVQASLPANIRSVETADSSALWEELKSQYSAAVGARQAQLLQQMWLSPVIEGEDPNKRMAEIRSAHAQINSSGENLSDRMLAYAMTLALPESFTTVKQTLWLREPLTSSAVQAAVQAEWTRRSSEEVAMANRVQESHTQGNKSNRRAKPREWTEKWCSIHKVPTHNTRDCSLRKFSNNHSQSGQARVGTGESAKAEELASTFHAVAATTTCFHDNSFIVDSGASHHMVSNKGLLHNYGPATIVRSVKIGNGTILPVAGQGTMTIGATTLQQVLHVPQLQCNLLAVNKVPSGFHWAFSSSKGELFDQSNQVCLSAPFKDGAYSLQVDPSGHAYPVQLADTLSEWHHKLGHLGIEKVVRLAKEGRLGQNNQLKNANAGDTKDFYCEACIKGKTGRLPSPPEPNIRASRPLELLHVDIWGPAPVASKGGMRYFLTVYDDYSHRISLTLMRMKSETLQSFKNFVNHAETQTGHKVQSIRSDRGGEFTSAAFQRIYANSSHTSPPRRPFSRLFSLRTRQQRKRMNPVNVNWLRASCKVRTIDLH